jgi:glycosyltransferase involved in cell wall biosynthesis
MKVIITEKVTSELRRFETANTEPILFISWTSEIAYQTMPNEINLYSFMRHQNNQNLLTRLDWLSNFVLNYRSVAGNHQFEFQNSLGKIAAKIYMADNNRHQVSHIDTFDESDRRVEMQLFDEHSTSQIFTYDADGRPVTSHFSNDDGTIQIIFYWRFQHGKLENVGMSIQQDGNEQFYNSYWDWQIAQFKLLIGRCSDISEVLSYEAPLLSLSLPTRRITKNELTYALALNAYHAKKEPHFWIVNFDDENHWKPRTDIVKTMIHVNQNQFKSMQFDSPYVDEESWISSQLQKYESAMSAGDVIIWQYPKYSPKLELAVIEWSRERNILIVGLVHDVTMLRVDTNKLKHYDLSSDKIVLQSFDTVILSKGFVQPLNDIGVMLKHIIPLAMYDFLYDRPIMPATYQKSVVYAGSLSKFPNLSQVNFDLTVYGEKNFSSIVVDQPHITNGGFVEASELPTKLSSGYGLIWDESDDDAYLKQYTQWNWPYKFSLYMVSGLPVIAWQGSAIAEVIRKKEVGIVIADLSELSAAIDNITKNQYDQMAKNATILGQQLATGSTTKKIIQDLEAFLGGQSSISL